MATLKRHWRTFSLQSLLAVTLLGLAMTAFWPGSFLAFAQEQAQADLEPGLYTQVQQLRRELALGNADLATLGTTQATAEAVLTAVLSWTEQHQAELRQRDQAIHTARRTLREAMEQIHVGPRDEAVLASVPGLHRSVDGALASRAQLLEQAAAAATTPLSMEQRTLWQTRRSNGELPRRYRAAAHVTSDQHQALLKELHKGARRGASAAQQEAAVLNFSQRQAVQAAGEQRGAAMNEVLMAEEKVLPMPEVLKEELAVTEDAAQQ